MSVIVCSETLHESTSQYLLLLVGFDTLIYRKYYDRSPILWVITLLLIGILFSICVLSLMCCLIRFLLISLTSCVDVFWNQSVVDLICPQSCVDLDFDIIWKTFSCHTLVCILLVSLPGKGLLVAHLFGILWRILEKVGCATEFYKNTLGKAWWHSCYGL